MKGTFEDYEDKHPDSALLVVEVADTTLDYNRNKKAFLYAAGGIEDYWIVNLARRQLEVLRGPVRDRHQPFGFRYSRTTILRPGEKIAPLAKPKVTIEVKKLFPKHH